MDLDYFCKACKKRWRYEQMAQTSHADGGWLICPSCHCDLLSDVIEMVAKDVLHPLEQSNERVFSDYEIGETMLNYCPAHLTPLQSNIPCNLRPDTYGGLVLEVDGMAIQRLRPDGSICRYVVADARAAELGLRLDDKGYVLCV